MRGNVGPALSGKYNGAIVTVMQHLCLPGRGLVVKSSCYNGQSIWYSCYNASYNNVVGNLTAGYCVLVIYVPVGVAKSSCSSAAAHLSVPC